MLYQVRISIVGVDEKTGAVVAPYGEPLVVAEYPEADQAEDLRDDLDLEGQIMRGTTPRERRSWSDLIITDAMMEAARNAIALNAPV